VPRQRRAVCAWLLALAAGTVAAAEPAPLRETDLLVELASGAVAGFRVEIADDDVERSRGLMHRRELAGDRGMLLWWPIAREVNIWMENTHVPLDILFIDPAMRIVRIAESAEPLDRALIPSGRKVRAVLEINAGLVQQHGIRTGDRIRFPSGAPQPD
jgi:hypothetical protein